MSSTGPAQKTCDFSLVPRRKYAREDAPSCAVVAARPAGPLHAGEQRFQLNGGNTKDAQLTNRRIVEAHLLKQRIERRPLPATAQYPDQVSLILFAREAGISEKVAFGKTISSIIRDAARPRPLGLGVAVRVVQPGPARPRLKDTRDFAIAERQRENECSSIARDTGVSDLRSLIVVKVARNTYRNLNLDAETALADFRKRVDEGKVRVSNREKSALSYVEKCLTKQLESDGMPDDFAGRFTVLVKRSGLTFAALERLVGATRGLFDSWGRGRSNPDEWNEPLVSRCAEVLGVKAEFLLDSIERGRIGVAKLPVGLFPKSIQGSKFIPLRKAMAAEFPVNIKYLDKDVQHRIVRDTMSRCQRALAVPSGHSKACLDPYGYRDWNSHAAAQFDRLRKYMSQPVSRDAPTRETTWSEDTAYIRHNQLCFAFGYCVNEEAGDQRLKPEQISLALLANFELLRNSLAFRLERKKMNNGEQNVVELDAEFFSSVGGMFRERGWIRNDAEMRDELGFGCKDDTAWQTFCDGIAAKYAQEAKVLRRQAKRTRPKFEAVRPALDLPEPTSAIKFLANALAVEYRTYVNSHPSYADVVLQDEVLNLMLEQAPFRTGTLVRLEYFPDNSGHLRQDADGWYLVIPKKIFKNGKYMDGDFRRRLKDRWGLYDKLEKFVKEARFRLLGDIRSPYLFVFGLKNLPAFIEKPCRKTMKPIKDALAARVYKFTTRHLTWDAKRGKGIAGFKKGFRPCAYRHIGFSSIIRKSGDWQQAADLINDSVEVTKEYYAEFKMHHRDEKRELTKSDIAIAAEAGAHELEEKARAAAKSAGRKS